MDMVGRLRDDRLSVAGTRTMRGLRELVSRANVAADLKIDFPWEMVDNSDHHAFYRRRIPALLLHTGLHEDYHRPSDDAYKVNGRGIERVAMLAFDIAYAAAERDSIGGFRLAAQSESTGSQQRFEQPVTPPPPRLGITWRVDDPPAAGLIVQSVVPQSAADRAGILVGDQLLELDGQLLGDGSQLRFRVLTSRAPIELKISRTLDSPPTSLTVPLDGEPSRLGFSWRVNDAEPGVVTLSRVEPQSPADLAGLRLTDRIYEIAGERFATSSQFAALAKTQPLPLELLVERDGRLKIVRIDDYQLESAQPDREGI
jgi:hypothetical protein